MYKLLLVLITLIIKCEASLELVFSEEFNENDSIDGNKWIVIEDTDQCNYLSFINCFVNNKTNIRITNGTLVLAAIPQKHLNRYYTTPYISTKQSFTYGRYEMRAALPQAKMVQVIVFFQAVVKKGLNWPKYGETQWINYHQKNILFYWQNFLLNGQRQYPAHHSYIDDNLFEFNDYVFEWTENEMKWFLNGRHLRTIDIKSQMANNYNPFDKPFKISIYLGVGGSEFGGQVLWQEDLVNWPCSLMIIDYIRIYQNRNESLNNTQTLENSPAPRSSICEMTMPTIRPKPNYWKLNTSDQFIEDFDRNIWNIEGGILCNDTKDNGTCQITNAASIRFINETLTMAILPNLDNLQDSKSASIVTKNSFKFGRFEIRAAAPEGNLLRPSIVMNNQDKSKEINILSYTSSNQIYFGLQYTKDFNRKFVGKPKQKSEISKTLFDFHTYVLEWIQTEIRWMFDDIVVHQTNLINEVDDQFSEPLTLSIKLEVEPNPLIHITTNASDPNLCLMFIVDYVRIYEKSDHNSSYESIPEQNMINSSLICGKNKALKVTEVKISDPYPISLIPVISISSILIILLLIGIFVSFYIRMKNKLKSKLKQQNESRKSEYDDIRNDDIRMSNVYGENPYDNYDVCYDYPTLGETDSPYLEITENDVYQTSHHTSTNHYTQMDKVKL